MGLGDSVGNPGGQQTPACKSLDHPRSVQARGLVWSFTREASASEWSWKATFQVRTLRGFRGLRWAGGWGSVDQKSRCQTKTFPLPRAATYVLLEAGKAPWRLADTGSLGGHALGT